MAQQSESVVSEASNWPDLAVRGAIVIGLVVWSFLIIRPFISVVVWGVILAVALLPTYSGLVGRLGGRRKWSAALLVLTILATLFAPALLLLDSLVDGVASLDTAYEEGRLRVPAAPESVGQIPVIGERIAETWQLAHEDFAAATEVVRPQLDAARNFLVTTAANAATASAKFLFALVVMGVFLATAPSLSGSVKHFASRVGGERGVSFIELGRDTIRSVTKGILGVAALQAVLGGLGCLVAGVPAAGLWSLLILVLSVAQLGPVLVLLPISIYVFNTEPTWLAVLFAVWSVAVAAVDNVLKPLLLGRGVKAPMLVVFIGAIGGMLLSGLVGLFVGPVVLVVTYTLFKTWMGEPTETVPEKEEHAPA